VNRIVLVLCLLVLAARTGAEEGTAPGSAELDEVLASMQKAADGVQDLTASFTYVRCLYVFEDRSEKSGTLRFKKPEFVRIDYQKPYVWHIYITPELYQDYRPASNVLTRARRERSQERQGTETLAIAMGTSPSKLRERFTLALVEDPTLKPAQRSAFRVIQLIPKKGELPEDVVMVRLWVATGEWLPRRVTSFKRSEDPEGWNGDPEDWSGDTESFLFTDIKTNQGLAGRVFEFRPPAGVQPVVDDLTPAPPEGL